MARWRKPRRRLHQARQQGRFTQRQLFGCLVKIGACRRADAVRAVTEIDRAEIILQDLVLAQPRLQIERDDDLLQLALDRPFRRQEAGFRQLLGECRSALAHAACLRVGDQRPENADGINAHMVLETAILDGDEGRRHVRGQ